MYEGDLRELVTPPYTTLSGASPVYILCPAHNDQHRESLAVYSDHAHCYTCGAHYARRKFSELFDSPTQTKAKLYSSTHAHSAKPSSTVDLKAIADSSFELLRFKLPSKMAALEARGIGEDTVDRYELGHTGAAYVLPVWDVTVAKNGLEDWKVVGLRYRRDDTITLEGHKYWGQAGFNEVRLYPHPIKKKTPYVVLTEGEFDALLLRRYGVNAYSFTNGNMAIPSDEKLKEWFEGYDRILLWRDQDKAGNEGSDRLMQALVRLGKVVVKYDWGLEKGKDVTELWQRSSMTFDGLIIHWNELVGEYVGV